MDHEEFLAQQPKMMKEEILERNAEYLGTYLFNLKNPQPGRYENAELGRTLDRNLFTNCSEVLCRHGFIDEGTLLSLIDLMDAPFVPETESAAEEKVREILFPEK